MKKSQKKIRHKIRQTETISWLPIDSRLFPFFSFSHVHGLARVFLIIEIVMSVSVVIGTLVLVVLRVFA